MDLNCHTYRFVGNFEFKIHCGALKKKADEGTEEEEEMDYYQFRMHFC